MRLESGWLQSRERGYEMSFATHHWPRGLQPNVPQQLNNISLGQSTPYLCRDILQVLSLPAKILHTAPDTIDCSVVMRSSHRS